MDLLNLRNSKWPVTASRMITIWRLTRSNLRDHQRPLVSHLAPRIPNTVVVTPLLQSRRAMTSNDANYSASQQSCTGPSAEPHGVANQLVLRSVRTLETYSALQSLPDFWEVHPYIRHRVPRQPKAPLVPQHTPPLIPRTPGAAPLQQVRPTATDDTSLRSHRPARQPT